jgi:hypothetical protein
MSRVGRVTCGRIPGIYLDIVKSMPIFIFWFSAVKQLFPKKVENCEKGKT